MDRVTPNGGNAPDRPPLASSENGLARLSWKNWILVLATLALTTIGLATALPPLIGDRAKTVWPWAGAEFALLAAYSIIILAFGGFLIWQQKRILAICRRTRETSRRHLSRLYALLNVGQIMGAETDIQEVFDCITKVCVETFDCDQASLMLLDKNAGVLEVRSAFGHEDTSLVIGRRRAIGEGVSGWVAQHRRPLILGKEPDENCPPEIHLTYPEISAAMVVPIILRDELVGVINVSARKEAARFDEEDLHALHVFASNAGTCIRHTEHAAWMRQVIQNHNSRPTHPLQL